MLLEESVVKDACVVGVARTPMGAFQGALARLSAPELGAAAIRAALARSGVPAEAVQEVVMGNVLSAGLGQAPARQAALAAGLPSSACCTTVNKVCASGLKAVAMARQSIALGEADVVVAGGMESMSNCPHYLPQARAGLRLGHGATQDGLLQDGLWDPHRDAHMGTLGERCAAQHGVERTDQDAHALESRRRAAAAHAEGIFRREICPVEVPGVRRGGPSTLVEADDALARADLADAERLRGMRPAFQRDGGTITAGNASPLSDGAAALVIVSGAKAEELGLPVLATVEAAADAEQAPELFPTTPALAIPEALRRAGLRTEDIDCFEINEAFSAVDLMNRRLLGLPDEKVNVHGGAVALGHPLGASGARILVTLLGALQARGGTYGCAAICNGGGGASAAVLRSWA